MAGDTQAKTDFEQILGGVGRRFELIHAKWSQNRNFEVKFRTQIPRNTEDFNFLCDEWVDLFSHVTSTVWAKKISNTGPKIRFRKQYQCWTQGGKEVRKELLFDARRCRGTLDVKVLTDNPLTRRKNKHIRLGLNVVVKINFTHLHEVDTSVPFSSFVHNCDPQPEPPRPVIAPNDRLPQLVAEMVQKGLNSTSKACKNTINKTTTADQTNQSSVQPPQQQPPQEQQKQVQQQQQQQQQQQEQQQQFINIDTAPALQMQMQVQEQPVQVMQTVENDAVLQAPLQFIEDPGMQLNQIIPVQNMESIKFQVQPQLTQVVVTAPQLEVTEPLFMCQPTLMFDPSQMIPMTHHFVQVHPTNIHGQQGHFL